MNRNGNHHNGTFDGAAAGPREGISLEPSPEFEVIVFGGAPKSGKGTQSEALGAYLSTSAALFVIGKVVEACAKADPTNPVWQPYFEGGLVDDETAIKMTFEWIQQQRAAGITRIILDGFPRTVRQLRMLMELLRANGIRVKVIWFTTPIRVCYERPPRPDRPDDLDLMKLWKRMLRYAEETHPIYDELPAYGIRAEKKNLLAVDNSNITKHDVACLIIGFLGLDCTVEDLLPSKKETEPAELTAA